jgi:hypothetical protein
MLFRSGTLEQIAAGDVTIAFRRWRRPTVKSGGQLRTPAGVLAIDSVEEISESAISDVDAQRAGYGSRDELLRDLASEGRTYSVTFHLLGKDPRVELRQRVPESEEIESIVEKLGALDRRGSWSFRTLDLISRNPAVLAAKLAARLDLDTLRFKRRVRQLKELGLTESLEIGYRLSPRGEALLAHLRRQGDV